MFFFMGVVWVVFAHWLGIFRGFIGRFRDFAESGFRGLSMGFKGFIALCRVQRLIADFYCAL